MDGLNSKFRNYYLYILNKISVRDAYGRLHQRGKCAKN